MVDRRPCALWSAAVLIGICAIGFQAYAADATASDASLPQDITNRSDPRLPAAGPSRVIIRYSKDDPIARQHAIRLARALNEQGLEVAVYFGSGSAAVRAKDEAVLDRASRAFNEGHPVVMSINGSSDKVGSPGSNLLLSQQRASSVLRALVARGIPVDRFQLVAKGETEPAVSTPDGGAEERNRRVEISWR